MNDPKVFKLGIENDLGYPRSGMVLRLKDQRSRLELGLGHSVNSNRAWV